MTKKEVFFIELKACIVLVTNNFISLLGTYIFRVMDNNRCACVDIKTMSGAVSYLFIVPTIFCNFHFTVYT